MEVQRTKRRHTTAPGLDATNILPEASRRKRTRTMKALEWEPSANASSHHEVAEELVRRTSKSHPRRKRPRVTQGSVPRPPSPTKPSPVDTLSQAEPSVSLRRKVTSGANCVAGTNEANESSPKPLSIPCRIFLKEAGAGVEASLDHLPQKRESSPTASASSRTSPSLDKTNNFVLKVQAPSSSVLCKLRLKPELRIKKGNPSTSKRPGNAPPSDLQHSRAQAYGRRGNRSSKTLEAGQQNAQSSKVFGNYKTSKYADWRYTAEMQRAPSRPWLEGRLTGKKRESLKWFCESKPWLREEAKWLDRDYGLHLLQDAEKGLKLDGSSPSSQASPRQLQNVDGVTSNVNPPMEYRVVWKSTSPVKSPHPHRTRSSKRGLTITLQLQGLSEDASQGPASQLEEAGVECSLQQDSVTTLEADGTCPSRSSDETGSTQCAAKR